MTSSISPAPPLAPSTPKPASWFHSRVVKPRLLAALIWATVLTPLVGGVALTLLGAKEGLFGVLFSLAPYRLLFWTAIGVSLLSYISLYHSSLTRVTPRVHTSRIGLLLTLLRPSILGGVLLQALLGGAIVRSLVGVAAPAFENLAFVSLVVEEDGSQSSALSIHEGAVFIATGGFFAAARIGCGEIMRETSPLPSPNTLRLGKLIRVRKGLLPNFKSSLKEALVSLKFFFILYFLLGSNVKDSFFCPLLAPGQECPQYAPTQVPMNSLLGLTEFGTLWRAFVALTFLVFARKLVKSIVTAYLSEPLSFPMEDSVLAADEGQPTLTATLKPAAGVEVPPLARQFAIQHLHSLLQESAASRKPFFSLSQPGGHPHHWNAVSSACSDQLSGVLNAVAECNAAAGVNNGAKSATSVSSVMRLSPIKYMFQEFPGSKARKVFAESSQSIYAVSSLSHLISASFAEDEYGVVQKKLADILELLVNLYDAVEKNIKLYPLNSGGSSSSNGKSVFAADAEDGTEILSTLRPALRDATKAALYRIVVTFGSHLFGIQGLPTETSRRLKSFADIKE